MANTIQDQTATVGTALSYAFPANTFADTDAGDTLTYTATQSDDSALPSWLSFAAATRMFSGTPTAADVGTVSVKVTARDGNGGSVSDTFDIVVSAAATAPGAPTGLTATASGTTAIDLSWSAPGSTGGSAITGYKIEVSADGVSSWSDLVANTSNTTTTYAHTGLASGDTRHYRVSAINTNGTGVPSNVDSATTGTSAQTEVWSATLTPGNVFQGAIGCLDGFSPVESCSSTAILSDADFTHDSTDYTVDALYVQTSGLFTFSVDTTITTETNALTLVVGSTVLVLADAHATPQTGRTRTRTWASSGVSLTVGTAINVKLITNTAPTVANTIQDQTATVGTALSYAFPANTFADTDAGDTLTYTATQSDDSALPSWLSFAAATRMFSGTPTAADVGTVSVKVTARDGNGGSVSDTFDIVVSAAATAPGAPTGLTATASGTTAIDLSWSAPGSTGGSAITGYKIEVSADGVSSWSDLVANTSNTTTTYAHTGLASGDTRHYRVSAINTNGTGVPSNVDSATTGTSAQTEVWSATLTPVNVFQGAIGCLDGFSPAESCSNTAILSDADFTHDSTDYTVDALYVQTSGLFTFSVDTTITTETNALTLVVGSTVLVLADAHATPQTGRTRTRTWASSGVSLTVGTAINVKLITNTAPTVANTIQDQTATVGTALSYAFPANTFADTDAGDTLTYTATQSDDSALPSWLSFAAATRMFSGTPTAADVGTVSVKVTARDGNGGSVSDTFDIVVSAAATAPGAPTGLTATASGTTAIDLSWSAPGSTGGSAITGYKIEVSADGVSSWSDLVANTSNTTTTYAHTGLASGDTRHYRVSAINTNGTGVPSNVDSATTGTSAQTEVWSATLTPVNVFQGAIGCLDGFSPAESCSNTAILSDADFTHDSTDYTVDALYVQTSGLFTFSVDTTITTETNALTLVVGSTVLVLADAHATPQTGRTRTRTWASSGVSLTVGTAINVKLITNTAPTVANTIQDQTATVGTALSYAFPANTFADTDAGDTLTYTATQSDDSALPSWLSFAAATRMFSGTPTAADVGTVSVKVTARDGNGGSVSDTFDIVVSAAATAPGAPTGLTATASGTTAIDLSWSAPGSTGGSAITGYKIEVSADGVSSWSDLVANTSNTTTTYAHTGLAAGDTRHYRVSAINTNGTGVPSNVDSATTGTSAQTEVWSATLTPGNVFQGAIGCLDGFSPAESCSSTAILSDADFTHDSTDYTVDALYVQTSGLFTFSVDTTITTETNALTLVVGSTVLVLADAHATPQTGRTRTRTWASSGVSLTVGTAINVKLITNTAPTVANTIQDQTATVGTALSYAFPANTFADTDAGDTLTYTATQSDDSALPSWLSFAAATRMFSGTPTAADVGTVSVKVTARDGNGGSVSDTFDIVVSAAATAPGAPTGLTATASGTTAIDLSWSAPGSTGGSAITGYKIEVSADGSLVVVRPRRQHEQYHHHLRAHRADRRRHPPLPRLRHQHQRHRRPLQRRQRHHRHQRPDRGLERHPHPRQRLPRCDRLPRRLLRRMQQHRHPLRRRLHARLH